jgi:predicted transcriptional regulator
MSKPIPILMPDDLLESVQRVAKKTQLSKQDVIRQSISLGLPTLEARLSPLDGLKPFTEEEAAAAFGPDPEFDALAAHCASLPKAPPKDDE